MSSANARFSSDQLYVMASRGDIVLDQEDKNRLNSDQLDLLTRRKMIFLTEKDRRRLNSEQLFKLAKERFIELDPNDRVLLNSTQIQELIMRGNIRQELQQPDGRADLFSDAQIETAVAGMQRGDISVSDALLAAKNNTQAGSFSGLSLLLDNRNRSNVLDSPAGRTIEFLWRLKGAQWFLNTQLPEWAMTLAQDFIAQEMREHPDDFLDAELDYLSASGQWGTNIREVADQIKTHRVLNHIQRVKEIPEQFFRDVSEVKRQVSFYSFDLELNELLDKVEANLGSGDAFDQAAMLKHLRSFFEKLHAHVAIKLHERKPETRNNTPLDMCQQVIDHLQLKDVVTENMRLLGRAIYGMLSEEGVHALKSEREYVRLCRNLVAEYALVLFFELERRLNP